MGKIVENAEYSTLLLKGNEVDGNTVFKTCPKCGTVWKSNKHSKSRLCKRCAILESLESVRRKKGKVIICPYCGEKFISIHEAKHCSKQKCKYKHAISLALQKGNSRKCMECGKGFSPKDKCQKFCCVSCASKYRTRIHKPKGSIKYSDELIKDVVKKYIYKADFKETEPLLYRAARKRGLLGNLKSKPDIFAEHYCVYRYLFNDFKAVYIGLTCNPRQRDSMRRSDPRDAVRLFASQHNIEIPRMEVLKTGLKTDGAQFYEDYYVREYRAKGYRVLNIAKTGIGIGSIGYGGNRRYSKKQFVEVAKKVKSYSILKRLYKSLWLAGQRNGWLKECNYIEYDRRPPGTCTKEYCMKVAKAYTSRRQLYNEDPRVYDVMKKNGWLDACPNLKTFRTMGLTEGYCKAIAKNYSSKSDLMRHNKPVWKWLQRRGLLKDCNWFVSPNCAAHLRKRVRCLTKEGKEVGVYNSATEAGLVVGVDFSLIARVCRGKGKSAGGYRWVYA